METAQVMPSRPACLELVGCALQYCQLKYMAYVNVFNHVASLRSQKSSWAVSLSFCALSILLDTAELAGGARGGGGGMTHLYLFITEEMIVDSMESSRKKDTLKESLKVLSSEIDPAEIRLIR